MADVRRELAKVYKECKSGKRDANDAGKLGYLLQTLGRLMIDSDVEQRLEALEKRLNA